MGEEIDTACRIMDGRIQAIENSPSDMDALIGFGNSFQLYYGDKTLPRRNLVAYLTLVYKISEFDQRTIDNIAYERK